MNVLLINPVINQIRSKVSSYFPAGIAYLASHLEQNGFNVRVLDFQTSPHKYSDQFLREEINSYNPEVVGIGCLFSLYFPSVKETAKKIKKINNRIPIVIGGAHPTLFFRDILIDCRDIDFIVLGEGEESFLQLCLKLKNKDAALSDIDGLAYRENGEIRVNPKTRFIERLDSLPFPAFDKFDMKLYFRHVRYTRKNRGMSIITSRSCPYRCTFCSMFHTHGTKWRGRTTANVIDEIELLYNKHGVRCFQIMDDNMAVSKDRTLDILRTIKRRGLDISIVFPNGISINTLDREVIEALKGAGCKEIRLPIEHGSEYIRNSVMKKHLREEKIFEVIELCNEFKIPTIVFLIIGMPGEDRKTMEENINFVKKLKGRRFVDMLAPNFATPYPGTELFKQCIEEKLIDDDIIRGLTEGTLTVFDKPIIKLKTLSEKELIDYRIKLWKVSFRQNFFRIAVRYLRPNRANYQAITAFIRRFVLGF